MRIDDAGPRTWLLAGVAGWALLAWLLATAGMGGRVEPLPPDPGLLQPLPQARTAAAPRLGGAGEYSEIANRPLFTTNRRPQAFFLQGQGDAAETRAFDYVLTGVLMTPSLRLATIQPPDGSETLRIRVGEAPEPQPDWRLVTLNARSAVFEGPDGRRTLNLRVFDGVGGTAPTVVSEQRQGEEATGEQQLPRTEPEQNGEVPAAPSPPTPTRTPTPTPSPQQPPRSGTQPTPPVQGPATQPMTDQAQMEAIRRRIQERRQQLRGDSPTKPPAQSP